MTLISGSDDEELRQSIIRKYQLDQRGSEAAFNSVTELASDLFGVPIAIVTVLDHDRQLFRGAYGIEDDGTMRKDAFCNLTVKKVELLVIEDALADPRFRDNPLVTGSPHIRFYAGAPLLLGENVAIGSLCLIDRVPRTLSVVDQRRLELLADTVVNLMEFRLGSRLAKEREQALEHQAELLRATLDNVQQGIGVFDRDLKLMLSNDRLFELLGLDMERFPPGSQASDMLLATARNGGFGAGDPEEIVADLSLSIRAASSRRLEIIGSEGRILNAWRAVIPDGRFILTLEDVSEQRRVARMKDEFVSTVSHELRTPLTSICGALAVLGRKAEASLDPQSLLMLKMAAKNADRLNSLINDILDIEKLGSGSLAMEREPLDLAEVLRDACIQNRPFGQYHGVELSLEIAHSPLPVFGDPGRLLQALTNLVSNACKFSSRGDTVVITGKREADRIKVTVEDKGQGIPPEFRSQIFRRFAQADQSHRTGAVGTGLGLAITKAIVDKHDAEIGYESEVGQGTCFWISFPCTEAST